MVDFHWWHWLIFGVALVVGELIVPVFVLVWYGVGALLVALILFFFPAVGLLGQLLIWTIASLAMVVAWFVAFNPAIRRTRGSLAEGNAVGEVGTLLRDVEPQNRGQVRFQQPVIGAEVWECVADEHIPSGQKVRVLAVEGDLLKVGRA